MHQVRDRAIFDNYIFELEANRFLRELERHRAIIIDGDFDTRWSGVCGRHIGPTGNLRRNRRLFRVSTIYRRLLRLNGLRRRFRLRLCR